MFWWEPRDHLFNTLRAKRQMFSKLLLGGSCCILTAALLFHTVLFRMTQYYPWYDHFQDDIFPPHPEDLFG